MLKMGLNELKPGESGKIIKIGKISDEKIKRRLLDMGVTSGAKVEVSRYAPLGDPMEIIIKDYKLAIRKQDAVNIAIEKTEI
jgi:Fe2+ transport system protein FeoA